VTWISGAPASCFVMGTVTIWSLVQRDQLTLGMRAIAKAGVDLLVSQRIRPRRGRLYHSTHAPLDGFPPMSIGRSEQGMTDCNEAGSSDDRATPSGRQREFAAFVCSRSAAIVTRSPVTLKCPLG
jgi:hypothetical protein